MGEAEIIMARRPWLPIGPATLAAILAAAGLGIWSADRVADVLGLGGPASAGPSAGRRSPERAGGPHRAPITYALAPPLTFGGAGVQAKGGAAIEAGDAPQAGAPGDDAPRTEAERLAAAEAEDGLRRLVRDLEYNRELPEPPQQTVVAAPAPWRPPAAVAPAPVIEAIEPPGGPAAGGDRVTLRGKFLRPGQVMFGNAPAQVVSATAGAIAVVAPRGAAGQVPIAVTNDDGSFAVAAQPFTYVAR
jgi:hypothetical protein